MSRLRWCVVFELENEEYICWNGHNAIQDDIRDRMEGYSAVNAWVSPHAPAEIIELAGFRVVLKDGTVSEFHP